MKHKHYFHIAWTLVFVALVLVLPILPTSASDQASKQAKQRQATTSINATVYLSAPTLQTLFQSRINQQVPGAVNAVVNNFVGKLSPANRGWAYQMATTLIQPSAQIIQLAPQANGLSSSLRLSLYPGDPRPINSNMLVNFSVQNASTVQVSVQPVQGSPALFNGPLTTFQLPLGQLNRITTTPSCGESAMAVNLQVPVTLAQNQLALQRRAATGGVSSYVEIPAASLAALASSVGTLPINPDLSAQNIHATVQGNELVITSDIISGQNMTASATTYLQPYASNGNLAVHVLKTTVTFLFFVFPNDQYNQQIEQTLNGKLNGALGNKFNITSAAIGPDSRVPCAAADSLILTGTTNIG